MKNAKSLPAILIAICTLLACAGVFISGPGIATAVINQPIVEATAFIALDRRSQEAQVTAAYNRVLASEVVSDTQNTHAIARTQEQTRFARSEFFEQALTLGGVFGVACVAIGGGAWLGGRGVGAGIKHVRVAMLPLPLPDAALLYGGDRVIDTRTGAGWKVTEDHQAQLDHAQAVREYRAIVFNAFASAFVEAGGVKLLTGGRQ